MKSFKEIAITLFAIAFVTLIPQSGIINAVIPLPFSYSIPVLVFVWLFLKWQKENFAGLGFSFKCLQTKAIIIGTISGIILFVFLQYAFFPLLKKVIPLSPANLGDFSTMRHNTGLYIMYLIMGWIIGGVYEEIVFHGFIFTRLEKLFKPGNAFAICFLLTNIIFAFYHWQLGISGMINAFMAGIVYHALILRYKRNIWYAVFCHGIFDTIGLTSIYLGYW
jgi:membrane protease YdiL (CAAX protease family)